MSDPELTLPTFTRIPALILCAALASIACGLFLGLNVPPDAHQGYAVRIMFVHVPAAWAALLCFIFITVCALTQILTRSERADRLATAAAPVGMVFTGLGLITGSIWGKPMWGAWWVWDGRLTSFLLLFFLYFGLIALRGAFEDKARAARATAILTVVGAVDLPVILFSVEWWTTLHQKSSLFRAGGPSMAPVYIHPLLAMALGYSLLALWLIIIRARTILLEQHLAPAQDTPAEIRIRS